MKRARKTYNPEQLKQIKKMRRRIIKRILVGLTFLGLSLVLFVCAYIFSLDAWRNFDPEKILGAPQSVLLYDNDGIQVSCISGPETRICVPLSAVPLYVQNAFIAVEDTRFYEHNGVDIKRILGSAWEDIKAGAYVQGASTISQQLVKLSHLSNDKLMSRKVEEAILSYQMERQFTKSEILEMYINYVYYGGGFYGIEAAARGYFGVSANDLTVAQGALLAGILKSPSNYAPHLNMEKSVSRRNLILGLMLENNFIDESTYKNAVNEAVTLKNNLREDERGYYVDAALEQACSVLGITMGELLNSGYRIHTAMDSELQSYCEEIMLNSDYFPKEAADTQAAIVVVDVDCGGVAALMGGRESTTALGYNRAMQIRRQPGSVIKPIIAYAPALESNGYTTVSMLLDQPTDFNGYQPGNFGEKYKGWVTLREAVTQSLNIPAVKVLESIGVKSGMAFAEQVGIEFYKDDKSLALALGGFTYGVSPYQVAGAYSAFASGGEYSEPTLILSITDSEGNVLYSYEPEKKRVMSEENAYILTDMLKSVVNEGTGRRLNDIDIELAGKTGTTGEGDGNRDAWMAVYNPEYTAVVWMGYDDSSNKENVLPSSATGGTYPALIIRSIFSELYKESESPVFAMPEGVVEIKIDSFTLGSDHVAVLANALTPSTSIIREVFAKGTEPREVSEYWAIPYPPTYFTAYLNTQGKPVVNFRPLKDYIVYRLYREDELGVIEILGEWVESGTDVTYTDLSAQKGKSYIYYVTPVHPQLKIGGLELCGPSTRKIELSIPDNSFFQNFISIGR